MLFQSGSEPIPGWLQNNISQNAGPGRTNVFVVDDNRQRAPPPPVVLPAQPQPVIQPVVVQAPPQPVVQQPIMVQPPPPPPLRQPVYLPKPRYHPVPVEIPRFGPGPEFWAGGTYQMEHHEPMLRHRHHQNHSLAHVGHFDGRTFGHFDAWPSHYY